jgi:hypothetical protein
MTTRFAQEGGRPTAGEYYSGSGWYASMLACRRANTAARQHNRHDAGGGRQCEGHSGDWRAGTLPCRRVSTAADKHSGRWRRDGSEGTHPGDSWHASMLLCRRANTAARQLSGHGTGGGRQCEVAIPAVVGMRASPMPSCEHMGATAHSALAGTAVRAAFGYGVGKGRGPLRGSRSGIIGTCPVKGRSILGARRTFSNATAVREVPTFGPTRNATRPPTRDNLYTARLTISRADIYRA